MLFKTECTWKNGLRVFRAEGTEKYTVSPRHSVLAPMNAYWPFGAGIIFFLILAHSVYKMWIIQEPNQLALWNKLYFEEKKTESIEYV